MSKNNRVGSPMPKAPPDNRRDPPWDWNRSIIISIKPKWAEAILDGSKRYEYRKGAPRRTETPFEMEIYATAPVKKIVGVAGIDEIYSGTVDEIIDKTLRFVPHTEKEVREYFDGSKKAHAFSIAYYRKFDEPKELDGKAPRNFRYLKDKSEVSRE